jgi:hypothetical protein
MTNTINISITDAELIQIMLALEAQVETLYDHDQDQHARQVQVLLERLDEERKPFPYEGD